jgi:hypothetical protein
MRRNYQWHKDGIVDQLELTRQTAFHEAGHAAAIHLENKQKNLPSIYFSINSRRPEHSDDRLYARIDDGRLVGNLAKSTLTEMTGDPDSSDTYSFQQACEADIINFFAGPLAEAKYVSIRDNEIFNINLLTPHAIIHYGGKSDINEVMSYMDFLITSPKQREAKLNALFAEAFLFVQKPGNWKSITALAHYILNNPQEIINCEQAIEVLEGQHPYANIPWL